MRLFCALMLAQAYLFGKKNYSVLINSLNFQTVSAVNKTVELNPF